MACSDGSLARLASLNRSMAVPQSHPRPHRPGCLDRLMIVHGPCASMCSEIVHMPSSVMADGATYRATIMPDGTTEP